MVRRQSADCLNRVTSLYQKDRRLSSFARCSPLSHLCLLQCSSLPLWRFLVFSIMDQRGELETLLFALKLHLYNVFFFFLNVINLLCVWVG